MKPTLTDEQTFRHRVSIFDEIGGGPLAVGMSTEIATQPAATDKMDTLLAGIKWVFLFLPGATAMHCWLMMLTLAPVMGAPLQDMALQTLGGMVVYTFLILLGLGRLTDMRYLKVIAGIVSSTILSAVVYHILAAFFIGYSSFGWALLATLPLPILFAQIIKRRIDRDESV